MRQTDPAQSPIFRPSHRVPTHQLAVSPFDAVSRIHGFGETSLFHFFAPLLDQIMAQSHDQSSPTTVGTRTLLLDGTAIALITPLDAVVLGSLVINPG